ncbi:hypothetical protein [Streptomyces sp. NPDC017949]|uniref:hypothetical protein n=1 Tax=Streptomyces sp. NPDC017949 TaxID=3365020 RepID=UPI00379830CC
MTKSPLMRGAGADIVGGTGRVGAGSQVHHSVRHDVHERVLVHAAAGGVGHLAVQIAKHDFPRGLGADELIDHTAEDFTHLREVDVRIDTIGNEYGPGPLRTLPRGCALIDVVGVGVDRTRVREQARGERRAVRRVLP